MSGTAGSEREPLHGVARITGAVSSFAAGIATVAALLAGASIPIVVVANIARREVTG